MYTKLYINRIAKQLFVILLGFFPLFLLGQNQDSTQTNRKFSIGLTISPAIAYRSMYAIGEGKNNDFLVNYSIPLLDSLESPTVTYSFGLDFSYRINKHLAVVSGVYYSKKGYEIDEIFIVDYEGVGDIGSVKIYNNYIDVPLKVNFYILSKKLQLFLIAGISGNIFINQQDKVKITGKETETITHTQRSTNISTFNMSIIGGVGIGYRVSKKITIQLQPQYQRFLNSLYRKSYGGNQLKEVLYSYGIDASVYYQF